MHADWVRGQLGYTYTTEQLADKAASLLKPLDNIDQLVDVGDVENSAQIKHAMIEYGTTGIPIYWWRGQRTTYSTPPFRRSPCPVIPHPLSA